MMIKNHQGILYIHIKKVETFFSGTRIFINSHSLKPLFPLDDKDMKEFFIQGLPPNASLLVNDQKVTPYTTLWGWDENFKTHFKT